MASSAPSPITTVPSIAIASKALRIASIAAMSAAVSSPRQPVEQRVRLGDEDALLARVALVVAARQAARLLVVARDVDHERHRLVGVRLQGARRRVVGHDQHAPLATRGAQPFQQRADDLLVHVLDRLDLLLRVAHVAALVGASTWRKRKSRSSRARSPYSALPRKFVSRKPVAPGTATLSSPASTPRPFTRSTAAITEPSTP